MFPKFSPLPQAKPHAHFRNLLGERAWKMLTPAIKNRFGKRLGAGESVVYQGEVVEMRMNAAGRLLAQLTRLVGAPLPFDLSSVHQPAVVIVTEDAENDGQFWIRQYGRAKGFPHIVHSSKRFCGPTGLEEYVGHGIGMALVVSAEPDAIIFKSDHYFLQIGNARLRLPKWVCPGRLTIRHQDLGDGKFVFSLKLNSRLLGMLIHQDAIFNDSKE